MRPNSALTLLHSTGGSKPVRLGVLVPWANVAVEEELAALSPPRVNFHVARLVPADGGTALGESFLTGLRAAVPDALRSLSRIALDAVLLACTSEGFTRAIRPVELHGPVVSAFDALVVTLARLDAVRIMLATPYPAAITRQEAVAFAGHGLNVLACAELDLADGYPEITTGKILELATRLPLPTAVGADAVVLSCTGWRTVEASRILEQKWGVPVLSSNLALAGYAVALAGTS